MQTLRNSGPMRSVICHKIFCGMDNFSDVVAIIRLIVKAELIDERTVKRTVKRIAELTA